jgi:hypothetical protein
MRTPSQYASTSVILSVFEFQNQTILGVNVMRAIQWIAAGAALFAVAAGQVTAQEKSFKEMVIGAWVLTSVFDQYENGEKKDNWGGSVAGQLTFGRSGRFSQIIIGAPAAAMKTDDPRKPDAPVVAFYGTYTVDEAAKSVTLKLERASHSARAGTTQSFKVEGSGEKLTLTGSSRKDQHGTFTPKLEVKRP